MRRLLLFATLLMPGLAAKFGLTAGQRSGARSKLPVLLLFLPPALLLFTVLVIVPMGIVLALKLIPDEVIAESREKAEAMRTQGKPTNWIAGALVIAIWLLGAVWLGLVSHRMVTR